MLKEYNGKELAGYYENKCKLYFGENKILKDQLTLLDSQLDKCKQELVAMKNSKSWKLTSPLRRLQSGVGTLMSRSDKTVCPSSNRGGARVSKYFRF